MKALTFDRHANIVISYNAQADAILSPDKSLKLLPCDKCLQMDWKKTNVVSFLCPACFAEYQRDHSPSPQPSLPDDKLEIERLCGVVSRLHDVIRKLQDSLASTVADRDHLLSELGTTLKDCALPSNQFLGR